jgi:predicted transposase YbfD/YdcC
MIQPVQTQLQSPSQGDIAQIVVTPSVKLFDHFCSLTDPRVERTKRHKLLDIVSLSICGVLCGADGWTAIEEFGRSKEEWLRQYLELPNGIPSHDTIGRVFARLSPTEFHRCFLSWTEEIKTQTAGEIIAIDGKTLRRSYDRDSNKAAIHMVSAWACANRLVLGQVKTEAKSNEITAIPELLHVLAVEGCIVTIDAMGCQKTIAAHIVAQGGDYVLALKGNQGTMYEAVEEFFHPLSSQEEPPQKPPQEPPQEHAKEKPQRTVFDVPYTSDETIDGDHGRIEVRRYWHVSDLSWLDERSQWKGLKSIGMVEAERYIGEEVSVERRYYLSSLPENVQQFANAVRGHWGIENSTHWVLDVSFREDDCRIRTGHAPENFAVLRQMALNIFRQDTSSARGIQIKRLKAGWDNEYLAHLLFQSG